MNTRTKARVHAGVPAGGQFAATAHSEPDVSLSGSEAAESIVDRDSVFTKKYDTLDEKLKAINEELQGAVADLRDDDEWNRMLEVMGKFHHYSLSNQMLIAIQTQGQATHVAGFRKWQELGRQVRKGEKGIVILAPRTIRKTETDANGKPVLGPDGKPKKKAAVVGFTSATVFDVSQTDGEPLPDMDKAMELSEEPPTGFQEDLEAAVADEGYTVSYEPIPGGARGFTDPHGKRVVVRDDLPPANRTNTLAHELGHIKAGHLDRMDEYHQGHNGSRGAMEIEAESFAHTICRLNGQDPVGKSGRYVAGWGNTDPERVKAAAETVAKAVKQTLATGRWRNAEGAPAAT